MACRGSRVIVVHRATFGERGGAHSLLGASLPVAEIPPQLAGLADRPPGVVPPGTMWGPSISCGPISPWWVLWRTIEDPGASRLGMVQSHAVLIPLRDVHMLQDLGPLLDLLPRNIVPEISSEAIKIEAHGTVATSELPRGYVHFVELLTDQQRNRPVICSDEGDLENLLRTLWRYLWPEARRTLTCRLLFGPETLSSSSPDLVVITPRSLVPRWNGYPLVDLN